MEIRKVNSGAFLLIALVLGFLLFYGEPLYVTIPAGCFMGAGASHLANELTDAIGERRGWK